MPPQKVQGSAAGTLLPEVNLTFLGSSSNLGKAVLPKMVGSQSIKLLQAYDTKAILLLVHKTLCLKNQVVFFLKLSR